jgi:ATP-binding protein involved in chromosome partitioning
MRFAIPVAGGKLAAHFGHCEQFALIDVNEESGDVDGTELVQAPEHEPGLLPRWLAQKGVQVVIAGGMGRRAMGLFAESGIKVAVGAPAESPESLAASYLQGTLKSGENVCDH